MTHGRNGAEMGWRSKLDDNDRAAVVGWVHKWGLEQVARIIRQVGCDDGGNRHRPLPEWKIGLLLGLARRTIRPPEPEVSAVALELAGAAQQPRERKIPAEKLAQQLEHHFRRRRHIWRMFTRAPIASWADETTDRIGLKRVARIVAALTQADGKRGALEKMETHLLILIAHKLRAQPERTLHDVAGEVARDAPQLQRRNVTIESLVRQLERDFTRWRHTWTLLSLQSPNRPGKAILLASRRPRSASERRATARLAELMPTAIDIYNGIISQITADDRGDVRQREARIKGIKLAGRARVEKWFLEAFERQMTSRCGDGPESQRNTPRSLYELIEVQLQQYLGNRRPTPARNADEP